MSDDFEARCIREVEELHRFFQEWMRGRLPDNDQTFARVAEALSKELRFISTSGNTVPRADLLAGVRSSHGARPDLEIEIRNAEMVLVRGSLAVVVYEEWQSREDAETGRISTALLERDDAGPAGLVWLHVHETRLPGRASGP